MTATQRVPLILAALLASLATCVWKSGGGKPQAKVFDPKQCGPDRLHCGGTASDLCCDKFQVCCSTVTKDHYCAQSCPKL